MILLKCKKHQRYEGAVHLFPACPACQHIYLARLSAEKKQGVVVEAGVWLKKLVKP